MMSYYRVKLVCTYRFGQEVVHASGDGLPFEAGLHVGCAATDVRWLVAALVDLDALIEHSADLYCYLRPVHLRHAIVE